VPRIDLDGPPAADRLARNLAALATRQPVLAALLGSAMPATVLRARSGGPTCTHVVRGALRWLHSAYEPEDEAQKLAALVPVDAPVVELVGGGLGHLPVRLLAERPGVTVLLVEPELGLLRAMLTLFDLVAPLRAGRLVLLRAVDDEAALLATLPASRHVFRLPALADVLADRSRHLRFLRRVGAARGRILAIAYKLLLGDIVDELEERGFAVRILEPGEIAVESFRELCRAVRPHALFSMNWSPELARLATANALGYASWTIDPLPEARLRVLPGTDLARCVAFAHRRELVEALRRAGIARAAFLPLAAGRLRHPVTDPAELVRYRTPVSFAGVSLLVEKEGLVARLRQHGATPDLEARLLAWIAEEFRARGLSFDYPGIAEDGSALPGWLREAVPRLDPRELTDRVNGTLSHLLRLHRVERLVPEGLHVWGDEGWHAVGAAYRGRAAHGAQLTAIYNASTVNLDVPRLYQRDIATMRVFDILACGGVLLTEPSPQIREFFRDGEHLFTYRDDAEMVAWTRELARSPALARAAAERGRALVTREHLLRHRIDAILEELDARGFFAREGSG